MYKLPVTCWALLILLLFLAFSYSHGNLLDMGTVRIMSSSLPKWPNPIHGFMWPDIERRLWRGLIRLDGQNEVVPDIARRWEISKDGLVYTFYLRNDVLWDDGRRLTAKDVVFTFNSLRDPRTHRIKYRFFRWVELVEAIDDYTVRLRLKEPVSWFLPWLWFGIAPEHAFKGRDPFRVNDQTWIPSNGPFRIKEFARDQFLVLEASPTYYGSKPRIKRLVFIPAKSSSFLLLLKSGCADIGQVDAISIPALTGTDIRVVEYPASDMKTLRFNMSNSIWENKRIRQALSKLIDRNAFLKAAQFGHGEPGYHAFQNTWAEKAVKGAKIHRYNPECAQQLLKAAGWQKGPDGFYANKDGKRLSFTLLPYWSVVNVGYQTMVLKEQLRQEGVEVVLVDKKWGDPSVDAIQAQPMGLYDPVGELYNSFHSSRSAYCNPEVDSLLDRLKTTMDRKEKMNILPALQNAFYEDPPEIYLFYFTSALGVHKSLQGMKPKVLAHWGMGFLWDLESWHRRDVE